MTSTGNQTSSIAAASRSSYGLQGVLALFASAVILLIMLPLLPRMPQSGLDASWNYALNEAFARNSVFGKDLVFTFGPLGSVYTGMYHPATDLSMLIGTAIVAIGLICGMALVCRGRRLALFLLLPVVVILSHSNDPVFMALPLFQLLGVSALLSATDGATRMRRRRDLVLLLILNYAIGLLPLIKGSFSGVVGVLGILSFGMLVLASRWQLAVLCALTMFGSMCVAWICTGQPIAALPGFFASQRPIIAGYSEAMSMQGPFVPAEYALATAAVCVAALYFLDTRRLSTKGLATVAGVLAYVFITFKAGFVRQDSHPQITAGALLFLALALSAILPARIAMLLLIVGVTGWTMVERHSEKITLTTVFSYFQDTYYRTRDGLGIRRSNHGLQAAFEQSEAAIRERYVFAPVEGTVDVYPTELALVFAHHMQWAGRPVLQSYSVYTPELDRINTAHLLGSNAPRTIFFSVGPIDMRLPSLEDAGSWPIILKEYRTVAQEEGFLRMTRRADAKEPVIGALGSRQGSPNETIAVPDVRQPVLVSVSMKKTWLGRAVLALFKLPDVFIELTLADGRVVRHRFIPEMGASPFLLSPYVGTTSDFLAVAAGSESTRVLSFRIIADSRLWHREMHIAFSTFALEIEPALNHAAPAAIEAGLIPSAFAYASTVAAQCHLDSLNTLTMGRNPGDAVVLRGKIALTGWASPSIAEGAAPDAIWSVLTSADGKKRYYKLPLSARPDVKSAFPKLSSNRVGFDGAIDTAGRVGNEDLAIYTVRGTIIQSCSTRQVVELR
ncbi:hypothetical protein P9281_08695 [Caballeronia sp. LP003]|uniref:hypothetical protein n=1 Tax=Caballeronia sp. LP003 TaxID=3038551 RepID=UPI00285BD78E|nr:hypothetical protein [Caballeronia sp. LP003]MDR5786621.1 hypothetical protein [Caballeronia sp. LP003]